MLKQTVSTFSVLCFIAGCAKQPTMSDLGGKSSPEIMKVDNGFFKNITENNLVEVQSSQLELAQTQDTSLKRYAQKMVTDHQATNSKVAALAAKKQVDLPTEMGPDQQKMIDNLKLKSGLDFDKAYIDLQVTAHQHAVDLASDEVVNGSDPDVRALASTVQDSANRNLRLAQDLQGSR
jgi:putative membrane protein